MWPFRRRRRIVSTYFTFPTDADVHFVVDGVIGKEIGEMTCILPAIPRVGDEIALDENAFFKRERQSYKVTRVVWDYDYHDRVRYQRFWPVTVHVEPISTHS